MAASTQIGLLPDTHRQLPDLQQELRYSLHTRPSDLDSLRHVNHAVALQYLEAARWDWMKRVGCHTSGAFAVVVVRAEVDYLAELFAGELAIRTRLVDLDDDWPEGINYKIVVQQSVHRVDDDATVIRARITVAFIDSANGSLRTLQDCLGDARAH